MKTHPTDNHNGPRFADVVALYPNARYHWHQNAFNQADQHWMVGTPTACGGGMGTNWRNVKLSELPTTI